MNQKVISILTGLVVVCAIALVGWSLFSGKSSTSFETVATYSQALKDGDIPATAPQLPTCAQSIELTVAEESVEKIRFVCNDLALKKTFLDTIKSELTWNVLLFDPNIVTLTRVTPN